MHLVTPITVIDRLWNMKMAFLSKKATSPTQPLMLEFSNFGKWKQRQSYYAMSAARSRYRTANWNRILNRNCQVCQSANGYTTGPTSLGFINCQLLLVISSLPLLELRVFTFYLEFTNLTTYGRPIVPAYSCPTELISILLDKNVAPVVRCLPSHSKDSRHALKSLRDFNFLGKDKLIVALEIHL